MQIAFHIGANCTDEDRLLKSVLKNADLLLQEGIAAPGPSRYRSLIRETIQGLGANAPLPDTRDILLDAIVENDNLKRIILSNDNFICIPKRIFDHSVFYPQAELKVRGLRRLFPEDDITLFLGIRNPVTFLQETMRRAKVTNLSSFLGLMRPEELRWSDVIRRIKSGAPNTPLVVWCNEDSPLLWEQLIQHLAGLAPETEVLGGLDMLSDIITKEGMRLLKDAIGQQHSISDTARHEIIAEIWEHHAIAGEVEDEINLLDLDPAMVTRMSQMYDDDIDIIAQMDGVDLLLPFS